MNFFDAQNYTRSPRGSAVWWILYALKQNFHQTTHAFEAVWGVKIWPIILIKFVYGNQE